MSWVIRYFSLRHLRREPGRTSIVVIGIMLGVSVFICVSQLTEGVKQVFGDMAETMAGQASIQITSGEAGFSEDAIAIVRETPGVRTAIPMLISPSTLKDGDGEMLLLMGVDLMQMDALESYVFDDDAIELSDFLEFIAIPDSITMSQPLLDRLDLDFDDTVTLLTSQGEKELTVRGKMALSGPGRALGGNSALMYLDYAQLLFDKEGTIDQLNVILDDDADEATVLASLRAALPGLRVQRPSERGDELRDLVGHYQQGILLGSLVSLMVGMYIIYNTQYTSIMRRKKEIGTLRSIGASRTQILGAVLLESVALGVVGSVLGIGLGHAVANILRTTVSEQVSLVVLTKLTWVPLTSEIAIVGLVLGVGASVVAAMGPGMQASRVSPLECIKEFGGRALQPMTLFFAVSGVGAALMVLAWVVLYLPGPQRQLGYLGAFLLLVGASMLTPTTMYVVRHALHRAMTALFGVVGNMSGEALLRSLGRTSIAVAALVIGITLMVQVGGFNKSTRQAILGWIQDALASDMTVTAGHSFASAKNIPLPAGFKDKLEAIEGVSEVRTYRDVLVPWRRYQLNVVAIDYVEGMAFEDRLLKAGEPVNAYRRLFQEPVVLVSENLANKEQLSVGDTVELDTPSGERSYTISGVVVDYISDQGSIFIGRPRYVADFQDTRIDTFHLWVAEGSSLQEVRQRIVSEYGQQFGLFVQTTADIRAEFERLMDEGFRLAYALQAVTMAVALLGIINALLASVFDRARELGLLRAVGASQRQVRLLVMLEGALMGLVGGLLGAVTGTILCVMVLEHLAVNATGWKTPFTMPWEVFIFAIVASVITAAMAGYFPARTATTFSIVESIQYE